MNREATSIDWTALDVSPRNKVGFKPNQAEIPENILKYQIVYCAGLGRVDPQVGDGASALRRSP